MSVRKRFSETAKEFLKKEIAGAGGNEVFALGTCDSKGLVTALTVLARGNESAVPALRETWDARGGGCDVFIHNHPSGFLTPSDNDLSIASRAAESGIGAYIVDNEVSRVYVVAEPVLRRKREILDPDKLCAILEDMAAAGLPEYEKRDSQLALMRLLIEAFNKDYCAAAEAGTGVGKSFAYLLPAVAFALANEERVVISTATITLQQQLFDKDIPLVARALGKKIKAVLVKGRGNYLCRRRLAEALAEPPLDAAETEELAAITAWTETTKSGSRSDLPMVPSEGLWSRICSESDTCMGMRCPLRETCFFLRLRRESADARLLVVNHHLLFADLAARYEGAGYESAVVLPPYTRVIIDEAHTIEGAATAFFSEDWSRTGLGRLLSRLYRKRRGHESGLLPRFMALLPGLRSGNSDAAGNGAEAAKKIPAAVEKVRGAAEAADTAALGLAGEEGAWRLMAGRETEAALLFPPLAALRKELIALAALIRDLLEAAEQPLPENSNGQEESVFWELKGIQRRLDAAASLCSIFAEYREYPDRVFWLERRGGGRGGDPWAVFTAAPIDVAPLLRDALFEANKTVLCVSATLTTMAGEAESAVAPFAYWANRCGAALLGKTLLSGIFPSPFPYRSRTLLAVPADAPLPDTPEYQDFVNRAAAELVLVSGGSALILFTSYQSLRSCFQAAAPALEAAGIRCLRQGDDDRGRLLAAFLADESSVLFATDSFWEGVDAPGDTLRMVILCRLPFRSPRDPVFEARRELVEQRGGNSFMELSLPDAVMKFKQGFGRLMRRSSDHGVVAVLDGRILRKFYGRIFVGSLPETKTSFREFRDILSDTERFLFS